MVELADTAVSKAAAERRVGSTPSLGTKMTLNDLLTPVLSECGLQQRNHIEYAVWFDPSKPTEWICDVYSDHVWIRGCTTLYATDPKFIDKLRNCIKKIL